MGRAVTRDVVPQAYGGQGDEDEVESVQQGPVRLQEIEEDGWNDDGEDEEDRSHQGQVDQAYLQENHQYWEIIKKIKLNWAQRNVDKKDLGPIKFVSKCNLSPKNNLGPKTFESKNSFGLKKFLGAKKIWVINKF